MFLGAWCWIKAFSAHQCHTIRDNLKLPARHCHQHSGYHSSLVQQTVIRDPGSLPSSTEQSAEVCTGTTSYCLAWSNKKQQLSSPECPAAIFGSILNLYTNFMTVDPGKLKLIYTLGGNRRHALLKVVLPFFLFRQSSVT